MTNPAPAIKPPAREHDPILVARPFRFSRSHRPGRWWLGGDPVGSAWFNALSLTFPRGEAFFIESVRVCRADAPPLLAEQIRAFIRQECNHTREHIAFNCAAQDAGYDVRAIDRRLAQSLARAATRAPVVNLCATAALEHFTAILARELLGNPRHLEQADDEARALWLWHAQEEMDHRCVAYDTWLHATRGWSRWQRWKTKSTVMLGLSRRFLRNRWTDTLDLMRQDGLTGWPARMRLARYLFVYPGPIRRVLPSWGRYLLPGFHPADLAAPCAVAPQQDTVRFRRPA